MNPRSRNNNQTVTVIACLLLLVGLGGTYEMLFPRLQEARTALAQDQAKSDALQADIDTLQGAQTQIEEAKRTLAAQSVDIDRLSSVYPQTEEVPNLYIQMENLMTLTPGVIASYQISPPTTDTVAGVRIPISLTATGAYSELKVFIKNLETNIRPLTLTSLSFGQAPTKDKDGKDVPGAASKFVLNAAAFVRADSLSSAYSSSTK